jgi:fumarate reductase flavoprotein subunit
MSIDFKRTSDAETLEADIVVIGGGGVGLAAALSAREKGMDVTILEKRRTPGGNAAIAGGIFAAESHLQKQMKIDAKRDDFFRIAMSQSHWKINPKIIRAIVVKSGDTIQWLEEKGVKFEGVPHFLPNQVRIFHLPQGHGAGLVKALVQTCKDSGVQLLYETPAKRIVTGEKGRVVGVLSEIKEKELRVNAKAVIIATGGYAGNKELLKKYYPDYTEDLYSVGMPHMGDGLLMATEIGAASEGLGNLQLRGPYFRGSLNLITVAMEPNTIWVNKNGERFVDEASGFYWPEAANALNRQPDKISYTLFDEKIKQKFIEEGMNKGYSRFTAGTKMTDLGEKLRLGSEKEGVKISDSWEEMARWIGVFPKVLKGTINEYNGFCDRGHDEMFVKDRKFLVSLRTPPYYGLKCYQGFLGTIGGIKINHQMEVLNHQEEPIPGLYAGGNDTGGWESDTYSLILSGFAFGFAVNSGRIAGENAAQHIRKMTK